MSEPSPERKADFPSAEDFQAAAWLLKCDVAAIQAVAEVEAGPFGAFLQDEPGQPPVILFEPHIFHRLTKGKFAGRKCPGAPTDARWAVLSYPSWRPGWYGPGSVQHRRLHAAVQLSRSAALMSASWGLFQILGTNHAACGFPDIQRFVTAMYRSVEDHLRAFTMFIRHDKRLVDAIRSRDWATFARIYNGKSYARNKYDTRMAAAFRRLSS